MSQISFTPHLSSDPINQTPNVSLQNPVGNVGDKTVQENQPPAFAKLNVSQQPRRNFLENRGTLRRPTSGGSTRPTFASFRKSTTSTQATPQNQSVETPKTPRPSFSSIKNQSPSGGERGQAMIGKNRSMPQAQAQTEVEKHESKTQVEQKTTKQTQSSSSVENTNQTEEKELLTGFKKFSNEISKKLDALIAGMKGLTDSAKAKLLGYDKAINEKFGEALSTKLFTFEEKKVLVSFIKRSSIETDTGLNNVIGYETNVLRNALLKALPGKITDGVDKQTFEELKQHGGGAYNDNVLRFDPLNSGSTAIHGDIKETTLKLCDLYKKYVDPSAFPEPEKKTIDTSDLNENETTMFNYLSRFVQDQSGANLEIFAKIFTVGNGLLDTIPSERPNVLMDDIERMIKQQVKNRELKPEQAEQFKTEQLEKAYQIIQQNPELTYEEFKQKCAEQILNG